MNMSQVANITGQRQCWCSKVEKQNGWLKALDAVTDWTYQVMNLCGTLLLHPNFTRTCRVQSVGSALPHGLP